MRNIIIPVELSDDHPAWELLGDFRLSTRRRVLSRIIGTLLDAIDTHNEDARATADTRAIVEATLSAMIGDANAMEFCLGATDPDAVDQAKALYSILQRMGAERLTTEPQQVEPKIEGCSDLLLSRDVLRD